MNGHRESVRQRWTRTAIPLGILACFFFATTASADSKEDGKLRAMSGEEKIETASEARRGLAQSAQRIAQMKEDAVRANEDAAQVQCLDDAASSVNGFLSVAQKSYESLQVAVSAQDDRTANHHLMMVSTSAQRASSIEAKASQCLGNALRYVGDSQNAQQLSPRLADFDPTDLDDDSGGAFIFLDELPPKATAER